jgi:putative phosphoesterase
VRVALISDLHGNLPALEAVLAELEHEEFDKLVCLGDVAVGPQPTETLRRVKGLGCPVVMGNWDAWFLSDLPSHSDELGRKLVETGAWSAEQLSPADREYMQTFQQRLELPLDGTTTLLCVHGSPRSYEDFILATTPDESLEQMLDGQRAPVMAAGHTHFQMLRRHNELLLVNPGSVGLPFRHPDADQVMRIGRWAEYGLIGLDDGRLTVELRRTLFDVDDFLRAALRTGMPHAEWWVGTWRQE